MDLNYYLQREQVERTRADKATHRAAAEAHRTLAGLYRAEIERYLGARMPTPMPTPMPMSGGLTA